MFLPADPRRGEILKLAGHATQGGLLDNQRTRWRELVTQLLGAIKDESGGQIPERRQHLRADAELPVDILAPDQIARLVTSSIGSGGLALRVEEVIPALTLLDLSIKVEQRRIPLLVRAQVVYSHPGELGACFIDIYQHDRELLEGVAVKALLGADETARKGSTQEK